MALQSESLLPYIDKIKLESDGEAIFKGFSDVGQTMIDYQKRKEERALREEQTEATKLANAEARANFDLMNSRVERNTGKRLIEPQKPFQLVLDENGKFVSKYTQPFNPYDAFGGTPEDISPDSVGAKLFGIEPLSVASNQNGLTFGQGYKLQKLSNLNAQNQANPADYLENPQYQTPQEKYQNDLAQYNIAKANYDEAQKNSVTHREFLANQEARSKLLANDKTAQDIVFAQVKFPSDIYHLKSETGLNIAKAAELLGRENTQDKKLFAESYTRIVKLGDPETTQQANIIFANNTMDYLTRTAALNELYAVAYVNVTVAKTNKSLTGGAIESIVAGDTMFGLLDRLVERYDPNYTGIEEQWRGVNSMLPEKLRIGEPKDARGYLDFSNIFEKILTDTSFINGGKNLTANEIARIRAALPNPTLDQPDAFLIKMANTYEVYADIMQKRITANLAADKTCDAIGAGYIDAIALARDRANLIRASIEDNTYKNPHPFQNKLYQDRHTTTRSTPAPKTQEKAEPNGTPEQPRETQAGSAHWKST
ncbi:MAG: hypothetical protein LBN32_00445 [Helicobacteraceae bacterium]|nr:hypothetical protein [Helicobacteraceae bacterium]